MGPKVNGRDELTIEEKVYFDAEYLLKSSIRFDLYIIWLTIRKSQQRRNHTLINKIFFKTLYLP